MAKKRDLEEVDDADLLSESQFDLESDPGLRRKSGSKPVLFLVVSLLFAAIVAGIALYSMELGPFAPAPTVETTAAPADAAPASLPVALPLPKPAPAPEEKAIAKVEAEDPPAKGKKGKAAKAKKQAKKKKKKR